MATLTAKTKVKDETLEQIFNTVDTLKRDLTQGINFNQLNSDSFTVTSKNKKLTYVRKNNQLKRNRKIIIRNVTDFYIAYFPESKSVLYRIEVNKREQVKGYIFMSNYKENKNVWT